MHSPIQPAQSSTPIGHTMETPRAPSQSTERVLVCAARPDERRQLAEEVTRRGFEPHVTDTIESAMQLLTDSEFSVCLVDEADTLNGVRDLAARIRSEKLPTQLVCLVPGDSEWGQDVYPSFTCEIVERPYSASRMGSALFGSVERAGLAIENMRLKRQLHSRNLQGIIGQSSAIQSMRESIRVAAEDDGTVLVRGEEGTGAQLVAQGIHRCSKRAWRPFIHVDCSVHSAESLERHLFGTPDGVDQLDCEGSLSAANGGTIFLDKIDTVALPFQKCLVQLLESRQYLHPQSGERRPLNVRFIASMHCDPSRITSDGQFREDLLHKLSSMTLQCPPLRLCNGDVALWVEHYLNTLAVREGRPVRRMTMDALQVLEAYEWPGNVDELRNVVERACMVDVSPRLTAEDIRPWLGNKDTQSTGSVTGMTLREMERKLIESTFTRCGGNRERTAQILKIGLRTLSGKLREYGYPPRGGPGSNLKAARQKEAALQSQQQQPTTPFEQHQQRRAA
ncbi:sigma 54-interacting transcriptional regulator [bacterium]|nr:sigma 54-interacting transcriptional regulator [bacterium]